MCNPAKVQKSTKYKEVTKLIILLVFVQGVAIIETKAIKLKLIQNKLNNDTF